MHICNHAAHIPQTFWIALLWVFTLMYIPAGTASMMMIVCDALACKRFKGREGVMSLESALRTAREQHESSFRAASEQHKSSIRAA